MSEYSTEELVDIDVINGLKELGEGDDSSFFEEIVNLYEDQAQELIDAISRLYSTGEYLEMGKTAHTLKGASLNVGAKLFAEMCKKIEMAGKNSDLNGVEDNINELSKINQITIKELKNHY